MRRVLILSFFIGLSSSAAQAQSLSGLMQGLSVQVPEPGMLILFGLGAAVLGLRLGRKN
jgi:PEP-CTERM motif